MRGFELLSLLVLAAVACLASAVLGWLDLALAGFGCFYTEPIGGAKCAGLSASPFRAGFHDALGFLSIPWTLVLIFYLASNNRRTR